MSEKTSRNAAYRDPLAFYNRREEVANTITHGIGAGLSIAGLTLLVTFAAMQGDTRRIVSVSIYGATLVLLYLASTLYHSITNPSFKRLFRVFDHAAIYLLIAGTYTPFLLISIRGTFGWSMFGIVWGIALAGMIFKVFYVDRFPVLSTLGYVAMGWLCVFAYRQLLANVPAGGVYLLVAGGLLYTAGTIFYASERLPFNHAIWHLFVLGGSLCHFLAVLFHVVPA